MSVSRVITMLPAERPQSTTRDAPVMAAAASEARNATVRATSMGYDDASERNHLRNRSSVVESAPALRSHRGVRTVPGSTMFERML